MGPNEAEKGVTDARAAGLGYPGGMDEQTRLTPAYWWQANRPKTVCEASPRPDQLCPTCRQGRLAYDALFCLACPLCGFSAETGGYT